MVNHIVRAYEVLGLILIIAKLTNSVWQAPVEAWLSICSDYLGLLRLGDSVVEADVDETFLIEILHGSLTDKFLNAGLHTEASFWRDELGTWRQVSRLFHLSEVLVQLGAVLRVRYLVDVVPEHITEILLSHSLCKATELLCAHVQLFTLHQGMVCLVRSFFPLLLLRLIIFL